MNIFIKGKLLKVYAKPQVIDRDTNQPKPIDYAIQILSEVKLKNSTDTKHELMDVKIKPDSLNDYKNKLGKDIEICCSTFSKSPIYISEI